MFFGDGDIFSYIELSWTYSSS